ncbi:MAG: ECF-type sigma factor [Planctomycetota bacterium]
MNDPAGSQKPTQLADGRTVDAEELAGLLYDDLRRVAASFFRREAVGATLQPTALVHEAYLRLANQRSTDWESRGHFFSVAAMMMRRVLTDAARARRSGRRDASDRVTLVDVHAGDDDERLPQLDVLDLEQALERLASVNARYARIAELRFFAGLDIEEVGRVIGVSGRMIRKDWAKARAHLQLYLADGGDAEPA